MFAWLLWTKMIIVFPDGLLTGHKQLMLKALLPSSGVNMPVQCMWVLVSEEVKTWCASAEDNDFFSPSHHKDEQNLESEVVTSSLREQLLETWVCLPVNVLIDFFTDCPHPPHFFISHHPKMLCIWTVIATINVICIWKNLPEAWSSNCELLLEISHQVCSLTTVKKRKCLSKILKLTDGWSRSFQTPEVFTNFLKRDMCACVCIYVYFYTLIQYLQNWVLF